jgi:hypothetical protein
VLRKSKNILGLGERERERERERDTHTETYFKKERNRCTRGGRKEKEARKVIRIPP